jgi:nitrate/nitrite transporter NarK
MVSITEFFDARRIIILLMVLTVIPMFVVLGLPMTVTQPTKDFYNHIMALKKGDVVLVGVMQETA